MRIADAADGASVCASAGRLIRASKPFGRILAWLIYNKFKGIEEDSFNYIKPPICFERMQFEISTIFFI